MKRALGSLFLLGVLAPSAASTAEPASSGAPAVSSALPAGSGTPIAALPVIAGSDVPLEPSPAPEAAEWDGARAVRANRGDKGRCRLSLLREWLRIRCELMPGAGLVAGDPKGVTVRLLGNPKPEGGMEGVSTVVVLPLRRSESRIVSFLELEFEYDSTAAGDAGMLSIVWRPGHADPMLVMGPAHPSPNAF